MNRLNPIGDCVKRTIPLVDGDCYLVHDFLGAAHADQFFHDIDQTAKWHQPHWKLFGKVVRSPRLAAWYGDPGALYQYSGQMNRPLPWFARLRQVCNLIQEYSGVRFNGVLINLYRSGNDSMGWHSDDERELVPSATIASLSLGATRRFVMRHKWRKNVATVDIELPHGSLLIMRGATQQHWRHAVPRTKKMVEARINLTFREVISEPRGDEG